VRVVWGAAPLTLPVPEVFTGSIVLMSGLLYPVWRLVVIASGLAIAAGLYVLVTYTRIGMLVRAGATNARMVSALGVNIERLFMVVFSFGTMLAGFAGGRYPPPDDGPLAGPHGGPGHRLDADLCADGHRALRAAGRSVSGARPLT